jgi:glutaredoxin 3
VLAILRFQEVPMSDPATPSAQAAPSAKVEIYTKWGCPYCSRALALLGRKGADVTEYDITMGGPKRTEMQARAPGASTVPQIFINGQLVGGSDDLAALEAAGKLDALLAA